jgi:hypothetical protein
LILTGVYRVMLMYQVPGTSKLKLFNETKSKPKWSNQ